MAYYLAMYVPGEQITITAQLCRNSTDRIMSADNQCIVYNNHRSSMRSEIEIEIEIENGFWRQRQKHAEVALFKHSQFFFLAV